MLAKEIERLANERKDLAEDIADLSNELEVKDTGNWTYEFVVSEILTGVAIIDISIDDIEVSQLITIYLVWILRCGIRCSNLSLFFAMLSLCCV